jgi:hypothetical protein
VRVAAREQQIGAVGLMRSLRDEINRVVEPMTPEQRRDYLRGCAAEAARVLNLGAPMDGDAGRCPGSTVTAAGQN